MKPAILTDKSDSRIARANALRVGDKKYQGKPCLGMRVHANVFTAIDC